MIGKVRWQWYSVHLWFQYHCQLEGLVSRWSESGVNDFDNNILIIILIMISKRGRRRVPQGLLVIYPIEHDFVRSNDQNGQKSCWSETQKSPAPRSQGSLFRYTGLAECRAICGPCAACWRSRRTLSHPRRSRWMLRTPGNFLVPPILDSSLSNRNCICYCRFTRQQHTIISESRFRLSRPNQSATRIHRR